MLIVIVAKQRERVPIAATVVQAREHKPACQLRPLVLPSGSVETQGTGILPSAETCRRAANLSHSQHLLDAHHFKESQD
jgi:hypothetical protein